MDFSVDELFMTKNNSNVRDEQMSAEEILLIEGPILNLDRINRRQHFIGDSDACIDKRRKQGSEFQKATIGKLFPKKNTNAEKWKKPRTKLILVLQNYLNFLIQ